MTWNMTSCQGVHPEVEDGLIPGHRREIWSEGPSIAWRTELLARVKTSMKNGSAMTILAGFRRVPMSA